MRRVSKYLGLDLSDARLAVVMEKCSLENLQKDVETGVVKTPFVTAEGKYVMYRKGNPLFRSNTLCYFPEIKCIMNMWPFC